MAFLFICIWSLWQFYEELINWDALCFASHILFITLVTLSINNFSKTVSITFTTLSNPAALFLFILVLQVLPGFYLFIVGPLGGSLMTTMYLFYLCSIFSIWIIPSWDFMLLAEEYMFCLANSLIFLMHICYIDILYFSH